MSYAELRAEQQRQLIDTVEVFEAWKEASIEQRRRFAGSMRWVERAGREYLLRKTGTTEHSLGIRSPQNEEAYGNFIHGRERNRDRLAGLSIRLDELAPVNKAMGLGRLPRMAARLLRELDRRDLLGNQLFVVGTNALFAYEARAGVRITSELLATEDVDLMLDARQRLSLIGKEVREIGLLGILRKLDGSFTPRQQGDFRAVNRSGYHVDLIRPEGRDAMADKMPDALSSLDEELHGSPIEGLNWLISAPKFHAVAIGDDGYPAPIICLDPRVFALHKAWMSRKTDRDPRKRQRDMEQAKACAEIASNRLGMSFDDVSSFGVLPATVRAMRGVLADRRERATETSPEQNNLTPKW